MLIQARVRIQEWMLIPGARTLRLSNFAMEQLAVLSWLTSMRHLVSMDQALVDRTRMVEFGKFLDAPEEQLLQINAFLGLGLEPKPLLSHYKSISNQYSKNPEKTFTSDDRSKKIEAARSLHAKKIARGMKWAEQLIESTPALEPVSDYLS